MRSSDAMHLPGTSPLANTVDAVVAMQGMMRTAASECPQVAVTSADGSNRIVGSRQPAGTTMGYTHRLLKARTFICYADMGTSALDESSVPCVVLKDLTKMGAGVSTDGPVRVRAAVVSSRDVLKMLGLYNGADTALGDDCAGVWAAKTEGSFVGEACFGLAAGAMATVVCGSSLLMPHKPPTLSFEEAASTPTAFVRVQVALRLAHHGGWTGHRSLLVHGEAGGFGLAALQFSLALGAQCILTNRIASKRTLLRSLGLACSLGSEDTSFVEALACGAGGSGPVGGVISAYTAPGLLQPPWRPCPSAPLSWRWANTKRRARRAWRRSARTSTTICWRSTFSLPATWARTCCTRWRVR